VGRAITKLYTYYNQVIPLVARVTQTPGNGVSEQMRPDMSRDSTLDGVPERLVQAAMALLAELGPSAIKARTVASAAGLSTMAVYHHFGGIPELTRAVIDRGFNDLDKAFSQLSPTDDPIADLAVHALVCRRVARQNPHLYDLMFGLSARATYRPPRDPGIRPSGSSASFRNVYAHFKAACTRLVSSGRVRPQDPDVVAAQLWSFVHGVITLELAEVLVECDDPARHVLLPMGVNLSVGLGDTRGRAQASHESAARRYEAIALG
jgi:AcrR family transcriptional regulator